MVHVELFVNEIVVIEAEVYWWVFRSGYEWGCRRVVGFVDDFGE